MNQSITEKNIINKINRDQDSYRINKDILKSHEFDRARSPGLCLILHLIIFLSSILLLLSIETPPPVATFNITETSTTTGTLLTGTSQNLCHPGTASATNEAIEVGNDSV